MSDSGSRVAEEGLVTMTGVTGAGTSTGAAGEAVAAAAAAAAAAAGVAAAGVGVGAVATGVVGAAAYRGVTGAEAEPGPIPPGPVGNGAVVLSALSQSVSTSSGRSAGTLTLDISTSHDVGSVGAEQHGDQSPLPSVGMPTPLSERYVLGNLLGRGGYASVRQAVHRETGEVVAVKVLQRKVKPAVEAAIRREVRILSLLSHPNIVKVFEFHEEEENFYVVMIEEENFYVVMECIKGGALFDRIKERKTYTE
ncbi:kinase-like domain-containing protein, partial [Ochromonadaceae sp. CCMP2298]